MPKPTAKNLRRNCDDRARKFVHARGFCERCGTSSGPFECAHIIRRNRSWTRSDERNLWCLCLKCHDLVDSVVSEFVALVEKTIGWTLYKELEARSMLGFRGPNGEPGQKFDWSAELERWKAMSA